MKKALRNIFNCIVVSMILLGCAATCHAANVAATNVTIHGQTMTYSGTQTITSLTSGNQATDGSTSCTFDNTNKFTITAKNSKYYNYWITSGNAQNYSMKLTLTNSSGTTIKITYTTSGITGVADGEYSNVTMQNGESLYFTVSTNVKYNTTSQSTITGTVTIDSITTVAGAKVSFVSSSHGSYTAVVGNETVSMASGADTTEDYNVSIGGSITLTAGQAAEGYEFYCWMGGGKQLGTANGSYTINEDMVVYPVYLPEGSTAPFTVGDTSYMFWHQALAASKESGKPAVLAQNYTLPTTLEANGLCTGHLYGDYVSGTDGNLTYTIPYSSNLLIPYGSGDTGSFGATPGNYITHADSLSLFKTGGITGRNFPHRTLTVPSGTKIDCYGGLNPNGQRQPDSQPYSGVSLGGYGKIALTGSGTQLTVYNGGALYCYGYVTGSGMVEIHNGGKVHELLQLCDWTGGTNASDWNGAAKKNQSLFFLSQYYVQSIEAPMTIKYGAQTFCEAVLTGRGLTGSVTQPVSVPYITANSGLFILQDSNSYIIRRYDAAEDRMNYDLYGSIEVGAISVSVTHIISLTLSSSQYVLPLPSNMTFTVQSGTTTMDKNMAILPGAQGIVGENATMNLSGKLYIVDVNDWTQNYFFNRAHFTPDTGYSMTNSTPNMAPPPYVATLHSISPRVKSLVLGKDSSTPHYYTDTINTTQSGKLEVNGTLNITGSGSICTTKQTEVIELKDTLTAEDVNKVVTGTGFINYESTPAAGTLSAGFSGDITTITTANGYGNLAGVGTLQPFATGDYYGTGDYWYQHIINTEGGSVTVTSTNGAAGSNLSPLDGRKIQNIVARVANGGSITYTIPAGYGVSINDTLQIPDDKGVYTLSSITADTTLVLHEHSYTYGSVEDYSATGTCSICGSTTTVSVPVSFEAIQLSVEAEVMLRLKITVADDFDGTIILTEAENERTGAPQVAVYTMEELAAVEIDEKGRYVLDQGIAAGEMTGIVSIEAIDANGNTCFISDYTDGSITKKLDRTVLDYAKLALAKGGDEMKELARTMLTFGGYAQAFYKVDIENPAYNILPEYGFEQPDINAVTLAFLNEIVEGKVRVPNLSWAPVSSTLMMSPPQETEPEATEPETTENTEPTEPEITEPEEPEVVETMEATGPTATETTGATEPDVPETTQATEPEVPETTIAVETEETIEVTEQHSVPDMILTDSSRTVANVFNSGKTTEENAVFMSTNFMLDMMADKHTTPAEEVPTEAQPELDETKQPEEVLVEEVILPAAEPMNEAATLSEEDFGIAYAKAQVINFDARVDLTSYFTLSEGASISDYTFTLTYAKGGKPFTRDISAEVKQESNGNRYAVKIADIPVAYWDFEYVITVTQKDSGASYELRSSILAWAKRCITSYETKAATLSDEELAQVNTAQVNMAKAMYYYNQAANDYFDR